MANPQPFDPGYDYEADKDIVERLNIQVLKDGTSCATMLIAEAAGEIRALRLLVKNMERTINDLIAERNAEDE